MMNDLAHQKAIPLLFFFSAPPPLFFNGKFCAVSRRPPPSLFTIFPRLGFVFRFFFFFIGMVRHSNGLD